MQVGKKHWMVKRRWCSGAVAMFSILEGSEFNSWAFLVEFTVYVLLVAVWALSSFLLCPKACTTGGVVATLLLVVVYV